MAVVPYRRKKRRSGRRWLFIGLPAAVIVVFGGWLYFGGDDQPGADVERTDALAPGDNPVTGDDATPPPEDIRLAADENVAPISAEAYQPSEPELTPLTIDDGEPDETPQSAQPVAEVAPDPTNGRATNTLRSGHEAIERARKLYEDGKVTVARLQLNRLLDADLSATERREVRSLLTRIADETVFGQRNIPGDPLVEYYTVQPGDVLIKIGRRFKVPHETIMNINNIRDAGSIRPGQKLKIPRGPFHAKIDKSDFRMDVYLRDVYLRSYRVGLGNENGTPEGVWKVKNRLPNPTYYPPASAPDKRILPPDHPENPLGNRWIGLKGVEGDAVGRQGYGIHGTIEPESIGKAVSLGCVRMRNAEVAQVYDLLTPGASTVTIVP